MKITSKTNSQRQAEFKERMLDKGFKKYSVWINELDFKAGEEAAFLGSTNASACPEECDRFSWMTGYCSALNYMANNDNKIDDKNKKKSGLLKNF